MSFKIVQVNIEWTPIQIENLIPLLPFTELSDHDEEEYTDGNNDTDNKGGESEESTEKCNDKKDGDTEVF